MHLGAPRKPSERLRHGHAAGASRCVRSAKRQRHLLDVSGTSWANRGFTPGSVSLAVPLTRTGRRAQKEKPDQNRAEAQEWGSMVVRLIGTSINGGYTYP